MLNVTTGFPVREFHPGLTGSPNGWLEMRIGSGSSGSQIFRSRDTRCTIGSSPTCDVRLCAPGLAPVHCVIIRGHQCTVVRTFHRHSRLNGQPFHDAILVNGDRLTLGTVDIEILTLDAGPTSPQRLREAINDISRLQHQLEQLEMSERAQRDSQSLLQSQLETMDDQLAELERRLLAERAQYQQREQQLEQQLKLLERERNDAQQKAAAVHRQAAEQIEKREILERHLKDLQDHVRELETQVAAVQCERDQLSRQLAEREDELSAQQELQRQLKEVRGQLAQEQAQFNRERTAWEKERRELAQQMASLDERYGAQVAELETLRKLERKLASEVAARAASMEDWEAERRELCARLETAQQRIAAYQKQDAERDEQATTLKQRCAALEAQLDLAQQTIEEQSRAAHERAPLEQFEEVQQRMQHEFDLERQEWQCEREQLRQLMEELNERCLAAERQANAVPQSDNSDELPKLETSQELDTESPATFDWGYRESDESSDEPDGPTMGGLLLDDIDEQPSHYSEAEETYNPEPSTYLQEPLEPSDYSQPCDEDDEVIPVDSHAVLERLRRVGLLKREQEDEQEDEQKQAAISDFVSEPDVQPEEERPEPVATYSAPAGDFVNAADDDESSIQQYMDRLLKRARGSDAPRSVAQSAAERKAAGDANLAEAATTSIEYVTADQYLPRSTAPEANADLAAMRELANATARTAITTYTQKKGSEGTRRLFIFSGTCFLGGVASFALVTQASMITGITLGTVAVGASVVLVFVAFARSAKLRSAE